MRSKSRVSAGLAAIAVMIDGVRTVQLITHRGQLAAVIVAGQAVIEDTLSDRDFRHVQAMCLYAIEIAEQGRPDAYTDHDAAEYAEKLPTR